MDVEEAGEDADEPDRQHGARRRHGRGLGPAAAEDAEQARKAADVAAAAAAVAVAADIVHVALKLDAALTASGEGWSTTEHAEEEGSVLLA